MKNEEKQKKPQMNQFDINKKRKKQIKLTLNELMFDDLMLELMID